MMVGLEGMAVWYAMTAAVQVVMWCESLNRLLVRTGTLKRFLQTSTQLPGRDKE